MNFDDDTLHQIRLMPDETALFVMFPPGLLPDEEGLAPSEEAEDLYEEINTIAAANGLAAYWMDGNAYMAITGHEAQLQSALADIYEIEGLPQSVQAEVTTYADLTGLDAGPGALPPALPDCDPMDIEELDPRKTAVIQILPYTPKQFQQIARSPKTTFLANHFGNCARSRDPGHKHFLGRLAECAKDKNLNFVKKVSIGSFYLAGDKKAVRKAAKDLSREFATILLPKQAAAPVIETVNEFTRQFQYDLAMAEMEQMGEHALN